MPEDEIQQQFETIPLYKYQAFRVAVVTDLLNQNVPLEDVQYLAGHSNPRTTQIYESQAAARDQEYS
jgi:site-specific recombinase XerD